MQERIPTRVGDALILRTSESFQTFAVGPVLTNGQQDFQGYDGVMHLSDGASAVAAARMLLQPGGEIYDLDIDTDKWLRL